MVHFYIIHIRSAIICKAAFNRATLACPLAGKEIMHWKQIIKLTVKLWLIYFPSFPKKQLPPAGDGCYEKQKKLLFLKKHVSISSRMEKQQETLFLAPA